MYRKDAVMFRQAGGAAQSLGAQLHRAALCR